MLPPINLLSTTFLEQIAGTPKKEDNEDDENLENDKDPEVQEISSDDDDDGDADDNKEIEKPLNEPSLKVLELWTPNYDEIKQKKMAKIMKEPFLDLESTRALVGM